VLLGQTPGLYGALPTLVSAHGGGTPWRGALRCLEVRGLDCWDLIARGYRPAKVLDSEELKVSQEPEMWKSKEHQQYQLIKTGKSRNSCRVSYGGVGTEGIMTNGTKHCGLGTIPNA